MRYSFILFISFFSIFIQSCQSKTETTGDIASNEHATASDSLIIKNDELISDPFGLGDKPLTYLSSEKSIDTIEVIPNFEESIEEDTTENLPTGNYYRLSYKGNYFTVYKRADGAEFFTDAEVKQQMISLFIKSFTWG